MKVEKTVMYEVDWLYVPKRRESQTSLSPWAPW